MMPTRLMETSPQNHCAWGWGGAVRGGWPTAPCPLTESRGGCASVTDWTVHSTTLVYFRADFPELLFCYINTYTVYSIIYITRYCTPGDAKNGVELQRESCQFYKRTHGDRARASASCLPRSRSRRSMRRSRNSSSRASSHALFTGSFVCPEPWCVRLYASAGIPHS